MAYASSNGRRRLVIDVDEVLLKLLSKVCDVLRENYPGLENVRPENFTEYRLGSVTGWSKSQESAFHRNFIEVPEYDNVDPVEGSQEAVIRLAQIYEIAAVTNRRAYPQVIEKTQRNLRRHFGEAFDGRLHVIGPLDGPFGLKGIYCKEIGAHVVAEDRKEQATDIATLGMDVMLLTTNWNRDFDCDEWNRETAENKPERGVIKRAENWFKGADQLEEYHAGGWQYASA